MLVVADRWLYSRTLRTELSQPQAGWQVICPAFSKNKTKRKNEKYGQTNTQKQGIKEQYMVE